jgi:hypothetical protein
MATNFSAQRERVSDIQSEIALQDGSFHSNRPAITEPLPPRTLLHPVAAVQLPSCASRRLRAGVRRSRPGRVVWLPSARGSSATAWRARRALRRNCPARGWTSPWLWEGRTANGWPIPTAVVVSSQGTSSRRIISNFFSMGCVRSSVCGKSSTPRIARAEGGT